MRRFGGAGILPSGAVHLESPTTIVNREVEASAVITDDRRPPDTSYDNPTGVSDGLG